MSQTQIQTIQSDQKMNDAKSKHKKKSGEQPHEDFFGLIYATIAWNIVRDALFSSAWWAILISVIIGINLIVEFFKFIGASEARKKYEYHTKLDDLTGVIIAAVIVNVIMRLMFPGQWWAEIPSSILIIVVIQTGYEYYMTQKMEQTTKRHQQLPNTPTPNIPYTPAYTPTQNTSNVQAYSKVKSQNNTSDVKPIGFCPICGIKNEAGALFCSACGHKY